MNENIVIAQDLNAETPNPIKSPITVSPTSLSFTSAAGTKNLTVSCSGTWTVTSSESWCTANKINTATIIVAASRNVGIARTATITITSGVNTKNVTVSQSKGSKSLSITSYHQDDSSWSSVTLGNSTAGYTIGNGGCLLTSVTMLHNYWVARGSYSGSSMNPNQMNTFCINNGTFGGETNDDLDVPSTVDYFGLKVDTSCNGPVSTYSLSSCADTIKSSIADEKPVIIGISGSFPHYVLANGYDGNTIYIKDPLTNGNTTLNAYINNNFTITSYRGFRLK